MFSKKQLKNLKAEYEAMPIPDELDTYVQRAIKKAKRVVWMQRTKKSCWVTAAAFVIFTLSININPVFARTLAQIPGLENFINVLTFKEYKVEKETNIAHINVPKVEGLTNQNLEKELNEKLSQTGEAYYRYFVEQSEAYEKSHFNVQLDYNVVTDNEDIFVLEITKLEIIGSSDVQKQYYVIDKKRQELVTLEDLFKSDQYTQLISDNIISQMKEQISSDPDKYYWIEPNEEESFKAITKDQQFYINEEGKLVIVFNKYQVAPGAMGVVEFVIPTEVIQNELVGTNLIR